MKSTDRFYDDIVIGSSPLMLIQALRLSMLGRRVLVIDRYQNIGGSWSVSSISTWNNIESDTVFNSAISEAACHLIEAFPRVYQCLEFFSQVPFDVLDIQPIRVMSNGRIFPYSSRFILLASFFRLLYGFLSHWLFLLLGRRKFLDSYLNFKKKLAVFIKFQFKMLFRDIRIAAPRYGYAHFIKSLETYCLSSGINSYTADVTSIDRHSSTWIVSFDVSSVQFIANSVHMTSSSNMRISTEGNFRSITPRFLSRKSLVVEVHPNDINVPQSYVAFWNDPLITRISRIITPTDQAIGSSGSYHFLIETRANFKDEVSDNCVSGTICSYLERSGIIIHNRPFEIIGFVDCDYVSNIDQLPSGNIAPNVWSYSSNGNLAAGIAAWIVHFGFEL